MQKGKGEDAEGDVVVRAEARGHQEEVSMWRRRAL